MKKILFVMQSLYNGGAERSLINLLNELPKDKFDISLLLFKQEGMFLKQIPEEVRVLDTPIALKKLFSPLRRAGRFTMVKVYGTIKSRKVEKKAPEQAAYRWQRYYSPKIPELDKAFDIAVAYSSGEVMYYVSEKVKAKLKYVWIHNDYRTAGHPKSYDYNYLKNMDGIVSISEKCVEMKDEVRRAGFFLLCRLSKASSLSFRLSAAFATRSCLSHCPKMLFLLLRRVRG